MFFWQVSYPLFANSLIKKKKEKHIL